MVPGNKFHLLAVLAILISITANGQGKKEPDWYRPLKPLVPEFIVEPVTDNPGPPPEMQSNCENSDFSLGNWKKWSGCYGTFQSPCEMQGMLLTGAHPLHMMMNAPGWMDPNTNYGLPTIYPAGQAHVARIGDTMYTSGIDKAASLQYSVTVGPDSYLFVYRYAVVLQSGGHTLEWQPDFKVTIMDTLGNQLGDSCGFYYVAAPTTGPPPPGWNQIGNVYWKEWTTVGMNLTPFLGQKVIIKFEVRGCWYNTHYGYAYLSAYCGFLELSTAMCEGDTSATLTGPPGFGYLWSTVNGDTSINGDTTQSITVPNPTTGSTYSCLLTAVNGCQVTINTTLTYTVIHTGFTEDLNCAERPTAFVDTSWVNQNQVTAWRWFFGDPASGANDSSNLQFPVHSFSAPGTYTVTLISYSTEGCVDTMTKTITIGPLPEFTSTPTVITRCSNEPLNYQLTSTQPTAWFNWRAFPRVPGPFSGYTSNSVPHNPVTVINDQIINLGPATDTIIYRIAPVTDGCTGDSVDLKVAVKPYPNLLDTVLLKSICDSSYTNIDLNASNDSTQYTWTCTAPPGITGFSENTIAPDTAINQLLRNTGYITDTIIYHITGHGFGCDGPVYNYKVAVYPRPDLVNNPLADSTCNGVAINIDLSSNVAGTLFTWTVTQNGTAGATDNITPTDIINQTLTNAGPGMATATYHITPTANGCNGWITDFVETVSPTAVAVATPPSPSICSGDMATINLTSLTPGTTFAWTATPSSPQVSGYADGSGDVISQTLSNTSSSDQTVTYLVTPTVNGCTGTPLSVVVTVKPLPDVLFNPAVPEVCSGQLVTINLTSGVAGTTFTWTSSASSPGVTGHSGGSGAAISQTLTSPNTSIETVTYTVTGTSQGCSGTDYPVTVTINPSPVLTTTPLSQTICSETATNITLTASYPPATFSWTTSVITGNVTGNTPGSGSTIVQTLTNQLSTTGTIGYSITPAFGSCSGPAVLYSVFVQPKPLLSNNPATAEICNGTQTNVTLTSNVAGATFTWTATGSSANVSGFSDNAIPVTLLNQTLFNSGTTLETVIYHITPRANNCDGPVTDFVVTVHPVPAPSLTGNNSLCTGTTGVVYTTEAGKTSYIWTVSAGGTVTAGGTSTSNTVTVTWNVPGAQSVSVSYSDPFGCPAAAPFVYPVTVHPLPVPAIAGSNAICEGTTGVVYSTQPGMSGYIWSISAGGTITAGGTSNDNTATVTWNTAGPQFISVNYSDGNNCTAVSPTVFNITVNPLPVPTITGNNALCRLSSGVVYSTQAGKANYSWNVSAGGTITSGGTSSDNSVTVTWNIAGPQTVSINYFDANGCTAVNPTVHNVTVHPLPVPVIAGPPAVCLNSDGTYTTEAGMTNYSWTVSAGGSIISGSATNTVVIHWSQLGPQNITVNYNDANGCAAETPTTYAVNVNLLPVPSLTGQNNICLNFSATYQTDPGMSLYLWNVSPGGTITAGGTTADPSVTVLWTVQGNQTVSVNYTMGTGCTAASPTVYNVLVKPLPAITNPVTTSSICSGTANNFVLQADLMGTTFAWIASGSSPMVTGYSSSSGPVISQTLSNSNNIPETVTYVVTPTLNGCDGGTTSFITTVFPVADVIFTPVTQSFCSGGTTSISLSSNVAGTSFTWVATPGSANVIGFSNGGGPLIQQTLNNTGYLIENVTYLVSPLANNCPGTNNNAVVYVHPLPVVSLISCSDILTTTGGKPFTLKGGNPPGGTYSGTGVMGNIFNPGTAGAGSHIITYQYINTWGCTALANQTINVLSPAVFTCGNFLTDIRDNQQYPTVQIGNQCWMASNLNFGTQILSTGMQRDNCINEKYCYTDNPGTCSIAGGLYQWDEMMRYDNAVSLQGICPPEWHVPAEAEWGTLFAFYSGNGFAASTLKSGGFSGFNALLYGLRFDNVNWNYEGFATHFWSSTPRGPNKAWAHAMNIHDPSVSYYPSGRFHAFHLRCIKD